MNNSILSWYFQLSRGIRQGCPISALLCVLVAVILSIKLRSDRNVKGIELGDVEDKICQLVDDITIFMKDLKSFQSAISHCQNFQECSGLKLNLEKSDMMPLINRPYRNHQTELPKVISKISVNYATFNTLGIFSKQ